MLKEKYDRIGKPFVGLSAICCLIVGIAIVLQVFARSIIGISLTWSEEIAQVAMVIMIFATLGEVEKENAHLNLDLMFTLFPKMKYGMSLLGKILTVIYGCIIVVSNIKMLPAVKLTTAKASGFPIRILYYMMILGVVLWIGYAIVNILKILRERKDVL